MTFLLKNGFVDTKIQKAFSEQMNGCGELLLKSQRILKQLRKLERSLHVVWLDIANAYESVRKDLLKNLSIVLECHALSKLIF